MEACGLDYGSGYLARWRCPSGFTFLEVIMDSSIVPPEGFTQTQQTLFYIVSAVIMFLNPFVVKLLNKWKLIDDIPTNFVMGILAVIITVIAKLILAPDLSMEATVAVIMTMFTGSTLFGRAITSKPKNL